MKKLHTILFVLGFAFLVFLMLRMGIGQLWQELTLLRWGLIPIILAEALAELCHALSWRCCFSGPDRRMPLGRLFRIHLAGYAMNFLTPTASVGGDVAKTALLAGDCRGTDAVAATLIGKLSAGVGHLLFVVAGCVLLLPVRQVAPALRIALLLGGAALAAGIAMFFTLQRRGRLGHFLRPLMARWACAKTLERLAPPLARLDATLKTFYRDRLRDLTASVLWHLLGYAIGIFAVWYFLFQLDDQANIAAAARIWCLALWIDLVTFAVPLNLGVLEGGRILAFKTFGYGALPGMAFAMATRLAQLLVAAIGLVAYGALLARRPGPRPMRGFKMLANAPAMKPMNPELPMNCNR
jgi:uncharacterized protein (TIRG00374 family)